MGWRLFEKLMPSFWVLRVPSGGSFMEAPKADDEL